MQVTITNPGKLISSTTASIALFFALGTPGCTQKPSAPATTNVKSSATTKKAQSPQPAKPKRAAEHRTLADLMHDTDPRQADARADDDQSFPPLGGGAPSGAIARSSSTHSEFPPLESDDDKNESPARPLRAIDDARAAAVGIRKLTGKHLVLFTDVPPHSSVDELPAVFDQAFPQWCQELALDAKQHADWQMRGFLVKDRERFEATGLWPKNLPAFLNGYTRGREFWLFDQSSEYYRRHLLLHEGVHGIMFSLQKSSGPAWYMEGLAELLATHRWHERQLKLPHFPAAAADVPKLGRIELVQQEFKRGNAKYLRDVLAFENRMFLENEAYAWSWAAAAFLNGHPAYRDRFRALVKQPAYQDLNAKFRELYATDSQQMHEEWQVFISELAHGYDFARTQLDFSPAKTTPGNAMPVKLTVAADRGWQNTKQRLEAGKRYRLTASGQYVLAAEPKPWVSEPNGVTIRYHRGLPLGILLAVVRPNETVQGPSPFFKPDAIGIGATIEPKQPGTLYLRINDFAGELADNSGVAEVEIVAE